MYVCGSHGYGGLDGGRDGAGVLVGMRDKARWLVVCREMPEHFQSVWGIH